MHIQTKKIIFSRQKLLLALLQIFDGNLSQADLQNYLFLFTKECQKKKSYEFIPYHFGCFSFQSYADCCRLREMGILLPRENWRLSSSSTDYLSLIPKDEQRKLLLFQNKYRNKRGNKLTKEVYNRYPYYAIKSENAVDLMSKSELEAIQAAKPFKRGYTFFTIGYEGKSFENYLNRLIKNDVKILCDVRKNPLSRKYGFSKSMLSETLRTLNIDYIHIPQLGIASEKRKKLKRLDDYKHLFDIYEATTLKENKNALDKLEQMLKEYKHMAITCFEAEQHMCHRGRIAKAMSERPLWIYDIVHI